MKASKKRKLMRKMQQMNNGVVTKPVERVVLPPPASLRFSPYAWAKLYNFCHFGDTEVGGFGITDKDPLLIVDFAIIKQVCSITSIKFDDVALADFYEDTVDAGLHPNQFARIWCHTHPGESPEPSWTDERTFLTKFGKSDWSVMFILAKGGKTYARLQYNNPKASVLIPVYIDWSMGFPGSDQESWKQEYLEKISEETWLSMYPSTTIQQQNGYSEFTNKEEKEMMEDFKEAYGFYVEGELV